VVADLSDRTVLEPFWGDVRVVSRMVSPPIFGVERYVAHAGSMVLAIESIRVIISI
jgi:hypothetical protein